MAGGERGLFDGGLEKRVAKIERQIAKLTKEVGALMAVNQNLVDAQTRLAAAVAAVSAKVDILLAASAGSASPAEQDALAQSVNDQAAALEATAAKS